MNPNWMNEQFINLGEKNSFLLSLVTSLGEINIPTQPGHQPRGNKFIPTQPGHQPRGNKFIPTQPGTSPPGNEFFSGVPGHQPLKDMEFPSQYFY